MAIQRELQILIALETALAGLPFKPQAREFAAAVGQLLINVGASLNKEPDLNLNDLDAVEKQYMLQPTFSTAFILQGHIMRQVWSEGEADECVDSRTSSFNDP